MTATQQASMRPPSWERMWQVARRDQTREPARRHRDSVERADERRMATSRRRERWVSRSVCLLVRVGLGFGVG